MFKKIGKKTAALLMLCMLVQAMYGCSAPWSEKKDKASTATVENMIELYFPVDKKVEKTEQGYQIKQPDSLPAAVEEVMAELLRVQSDFLSYYTYNLDEGNNLLLEIRLTADFSTETVLLIRASVTKTLFQLSEIKSIHLVLYPAEGDALSDEVCDRASFFYYAYPAADY